MQRNTRAGLLFSAAILLAACGNPLGTGPDPDSGLPYGPPRLSPPEGAADLGMDRWAVYFQQPNTFRITGGQPPYTPYTDWMAGPLEARGDGLTYTPTREGEGVIGVSDAQGRRVEASVVVLPYPGAPAPYLPFQALELVIVSVGSDGRSLAPQEAWTVPPGGRVLFSALGGGLPYSWSMESGDLGQLETWMDDRQGRARLTVSGSSGTVASVQVRDPFGRTGTCLLEIGE